MIRLWLASSHHPAFRCGGWAFIRSSGSDLTGTAGGERGVTARRTALAGLAAAIPPARPDSVTIHAVGDEIVGLAGLLAGPARTGDADIWSKEELDLMARIRVAANGRVRLSKATVEPQTPAAFVLAWAELARDKAKATGAFTAPIPKSNLAKIAGLPTPG